MKRKIKCMGSYNGHQSGNIFNPHGISPALCCTDYKKPVTIIEGGADLNNKIIKQNFTEIDKGKYVTTTRERESCYTVTTRPRDRPLHKKQDNYILEKECRPVLTPDRINKRQNGRRMKNNNEPSFTLTAQDKHGVSDGYKVRRLTPIECERLQGFPDDWTRYGKDGEEISDTQRYKCCGNAVTTNVITAIVNEMFKERE